MSVKRSCNSYQVVKWFYFPQWPSIYLKVKFLTMLNFYQSALALSASATLSSLLFLKQASYLRAFALIILFTSNVLAFMLLFQCSHIQEAFPTTPYEQSFSLQYYQSLCPALFSTIWQNRERSIHICWLSDFPQTKNSLDYRVYLVQLQKVSFGNLLLFCFMMGGWNKNKLHIATLAFSL